MSPRFRVGNRVRVSEGLGVLSGNEGYLIAKTSIPLKDNGIPDIIGCFTPLQPSQVGLKKDDGTIFVVELGALTKLSED